MYEQSLTQSQIRQLFSQFLAFLEIGFQTLEALGNKVRPSGAQCETHPLKIAKLCEIFEFHVNSLPRARQEAQPMRQLPRTGT